jgi:hypothetical protein
MEGLVIENEEDTLFSLYLFYSPSGFVFLHFCVQKIDKLFKVILLLHSPCL